MIYGHGDDIYRFKNIRINFSSNTKPGGMDKGLVECLQNSITSSISYPEPMAKSLAEFVERKDNLPGGSVLITNGAVEAFYLIASWKRKHKSLIFEPAFSEYEDACRANKHTIEFKPNSELPATSCNLYDVVWLANPNNPDGKVYKRDILLRLIQQNKNTLFVIDEAYIDFFEEDISLINFVHQYKNIIVIRSLTKRFSIPGLRLGYLVAAPAVVSGFIKTIIPWRINSLAQKAGLYCYSEKCNDNFNLAKHIAESKRLQHEIDNINGFSVQTSNTTFFLVKGQCKASLLKNELISKHGILIRDASNFRGLSPNHFRIASQLHHENDELIKVLKEWR